MAVLKEAIGEASNSLIACTAENPQVSTISSIYGVHERLKSTVATTPMPGGMPLAEPDSSLPNVVAP